MVLTSASFFDGHRMHGPTRVIIGNGGVVETIEEWDGPCDHHLISPGLVDLQMNGWAETDVASLDESSIVHLDGALWREGTSSWLATIVSASLERMSSVLHRLSALAPLAPGMIGIHTEGPFLGGRPGAHDRRAIVDIDAQYLDSLPPEVRLVTLAAEQPRAAEACAQLATRGITVSIGHSAPDRGEWEKTLDAGATMVTHLFNGMSGVHHRDGGLALWALTDERVVCGLIADGHHVSDDAVRLAFAAAGDRVTLVSDSVAWASTWAQSRNVTIADGVAALPDGTLAGSSTSLLGCVRHAVIDVGLPVADVLRAATSRPAARVGRPDLGVIVSGRSCDVIALDEDFVVQDGSRRTSAD